MQQAAIGDCLSFDPFPFDQNGLAAPEVDVGGRQVADALVISSVIVVGDEGGDLGFEIARQVIVLETESENVVKKTASRTSPSTTRSLPTS